MGYVLHDRCGYVCDLAGAFACSACLHWLAGAGQSRIVAEFLKLGRAEHPRKLASEIETLLRASPPVNADIVDVATVLITGLRRARGFAEMTQ